MFTQRLSLTQQDAREVSTTQRHKLGSVVETADGRVFRYAQAGAVDLVAGKVNVPPARVTNHTNIAVATAVTGNTGVRQVSVTLGATAATQDQYKDGFLAVIDVAGVGSAFRVTGNPAIASSGTGVITLEEQVATSLTTSSKVSLQYSLFALSVVSPSATGVAQVSNGSNNVAVAAGSFYWSQTGGMASVLSDGAITKGAGAIISDAVAGAVEIEVAATVGARVGVAPEATVDAKYYPLLLTLE